MRGEGEEVRMSRVFLKHPTILACCMQAALVQFYISHLDITSIFFALLGNLASHRRRKLFFLKQAIDLLTRTYKELFTVLAAG